MPRYRNVTLASALIATATALAAATLGSPLSAYAAEEPWAVRPGDRFEVRPEDLPRPGATPSAANGPTKARERSGSSLMVPEGFVIELFADRVSGPRTLAVAPNGDIFVAESRADRVSVLRDGDGDGVADSKSAFLTKLDEPYGLAFQEGALFVADVRGVWRTPYLPGDLKARAAPKRITPEDALGSRRGHSTRNLAFHPTGDRFYVAIGSRSNIREEPAPRATVQEFLINGMSGRTFASGLRNPVGMAFYPGTEDLYVVVNERDGMGDELVPDYLTRITDGAFYGWPYAYIGQNPQPGFGSKRLDLVMKTVVPDLLFRSHSAPLGLVFYDAEQFPENYHGDAFVALHGSWNAATPRGYMVVRVRFEAGRPAGGYEAFMTGFWIDGVDPAEVIGRPAGLAVAADGSLLVADDSGGRIWRVSYRP